MDFGSSNYIDDFVSASRAVYAQNGYSVLSTGSDSPVDVDFWVIPPASESRIAVRYIAKTGDSELSLISREEINRTLNRLADDEELHVITDGNFSDEALTFGEESNAVTLIDGTTAEATFSALPEIVSRLGFFEIPAPPQEISLVPSVPLHVPETPQAKKSQLPLILTMIGIFTAFVMVFGAIVSAIAIPNIGRINEAALEAKNRRNAQNLASVCAAAAAAGFDFVDPDERLIPTLTAIRDGATINRTGPLQGTYFGIPEMASIELEEASRYLILRDGVLHYVPDRDKLPVRENPRIVRNHRTFPGESDFSFGRKDLVAIEAKKEAFEIARFMQEAKDRRKADYMKLAGGDKDVAILLLMSTMRNLVSRNAPGDLPEFDRKYSENSEYLYFAKQFLRVENGNLIAIVDPTDYDRAFDAYVMNDRKVPLQR